MKGYKANIEELVEKNEDFRRVLYTARRSQLVLMTLRPGEEIGNEVHTVDQFFRFESGQGKAILNDGVDTCDLSGGDVLLVPAGTKHNVVNTSASLSLKLYTLYSPPHHRDGVVHTTKVVAESDDEEFAGSTTEEVPAGGPGGYWFRAKRFGWGWTPVSWQGWVTTVVYIGLLVHEVLRASEGAQSEGGMVSTLALPFIGISILFFSLCWITGERPRWRWIK